MTAKIAYRMVYLPHPFDGTQRQRGVEAWCLVKVTRPEFGRETQEPVAIFNLDSEAETFQGHVHAAGLDGALVEINPELRHLFALRRK